MALNIMRLTTLSYASFWIWAIWTGQVAGMALGHWVATWTATTQEVESYNLPPSPFGGEDADVQFENATLRQTLRVSIGAERVRVQLSNLFGLSDLPITAASLAFPAGGEAGVGEIDTSTVKRLTFSGAASMSIPPRGIVYSDPIDFEFPPLANLALTIHSQEGQVGDKITGHPGSRTTSWIEAGNKVNASSIAQANVAHWYFASAVEVWACTRKSALVILGDSITDGRGSDDNLNNRWPDALAERLQSSNFTDTAVNNQAAGGNTVLGGGLGPPLLARYHRDALEQAGVRYVMIFEGVNDIGLSGTDEEAQQRLLSSLIAAYSQIIEDCKQAGLVTIGATITPFGGSDYADPMREETRVLVNDWILTDGAFDYAVDFAALIGDGDQLKPHFDSGDHLHPNVAAYRELAQGIDRGIFLLGQM